VAKHGGESVDLVRNESFDAILMDLQMPVMDGYTATLLIRDLPQGKDVPIIALSAAAMVNDKLACEQAGMNDHVSKPLNLEHLTRTLLQWVKPQQGQWARSIHQNKGLADASLLPGQLAGIDLPNALARMGGNQVMASRLLLRFATDYASSASEVDVLLQENQVVKAANLLHRLNGVAATLGATALSEAAKQLEIEIKSGFPIKSLEIFSQRLENTVWTIRNNIHSADKTETIPNLLPNIAVINEGLSNLAACLKNYELPSDSQLAQLLEHIAGQVSARLLSELDRHMQNFDFEDASITAEKIREEWYKSAKLLSA